MFSSSLSKKFITIISSLLLVSILLTPTGVDAQTPPPLSDIFIVEEISADTVAVSVRSDHNNMLTDGYVDSSGHNSFSYFRSTRTIDSSNYRSPGYSIKVTTIPQYDVNGSTVTRNSGIIKYPELGTPFDQTQAVTVSAWVKGPVGAEFLLGNRWRNANNGGHKGESSVSFTLDSDDWQYVEKTMVLPQTGDYQPGIQIMSKPINGIIDFYVEDINITNGNPVPGPYSYEIQKSTDSSFTSGVETQTTTNLSDTFASNEAGTTNYFRVRTVDSSGASAWSPVQSINVPAVVPSVPSISGSPGQTNIDLIISPNNDGGSPIIGYEYEYSIDPTFGISTIVPTNEINNSINGLTEDTLYHIRVRSQNAIGWSNWSNAIGLQTLTQVVTAPSPPINVSALSGLNSEIPVTWNQPNDSGSSPIVEYHVWLSTSSSMSNPTVVSTGTTLEHTFTGLNNGTTYYLQTFARNNDEAWSSGSTIISAVPATAPNGLSSSASLIERGLNINWSSNPNGSIITDTIIEYSQSPALSGAATVSTGSTTGSGSQIVGGMLPWNNYYYRVTLQTEFGPVQGPIQLGGEIRTSFLYPNETLSNNRGIWSPNYAYYAVMQADGNFVIYGPSGVHNPGGVSGVRGNNPGTYAEVTSDGRFHIINVYISPVHGGSCPTGPINLFMQNDGNLVVRANTSPIWSWATDNLC